MTVTQHKITFSLNSQVQRIAGVHDIALCHIWAYTCYSNTAAHLLGISTADGSGWLRCLFYRLTQQFREGYSAGLKGGGIDIGQVIAGYVNHFLVGLQPGNAG